MRSTCGNRIRTVLAVATLLICARCGSHDAELRIHNIGPAPLENVTVVFPNVEVRFGDVPGRSVTPYATVRRGVGPYAAFRFISNGAHVQQNVTDFVGWKPINGAAFTYRVQLEPGVSQPFLRVIDVVKDR